MPGGGSSTRRPAPRPRNNGGHPHRPLPRARHLGATENGDLLLADLLHTAALLLDGTADDVLAEQAWQLADAVSAARDLSIALVLPANDATRAAFPAAESIATAPGTPVTLSQLGEEPVQLQRLTDEQYRQYLHALQVAEEPAEPAAGTWQLAEAHEQTAAAARPEPHPLLRIRTSDGEAASDPGSPYPALLASVGAPRTTKADAPTPTDTPEGEDVPGETPDPAATTGDAADGLAAEPDEPAADAGDEQPSAPEISVLGPLAVSGINHSGHGPKVAALAALIHLRPGRTAEFLCTAMDPVNPWSTRTLQTRLSEIRSRLGPAPDGQPYLPRPKHGYSFHPDVTSDWRRSQDLATRGLADPQSGTDDLENALALLRGKPFEGRDFSWADAVQQEWRPLCLGVGRRRRRNGGFRARRRCPAAGCGRRGLAGQVPVSGAQSMGAGRRIQCFDLRCWS
ncbi:hypothetical protein QC334_34810 [Streptomyces sp. DH18]|uniref:AfsR/SARP family transcriptional regulator n=1 Tax=Streptomyces sp. DH18 TaxID=3040126 RepID=UPI0024419C08|nr:hypothetical protein [Streptomyces sp. DH18]MDG9687843.1 hypothetical protein [Streptomyces sp. DH18]